MSAVIILIILVVWWREDVYNSGWHEGFKAAEKINERIE